MVPFVYWVRFLTRPRTGKMLQVSIAAEIKELLSTMYSSKDRIKSVLFYSSFCSLSHSLIWLLLRNQLPCLTVVFKRKFEGQTWTMKSNTHTDI